MKNRDFQIYGFPDGNHFEQLLDISTRLGAVISEIRQSCKPGSPARRWMGASNDPGRADFLPWHTWHGNIHGIHRQVTSMFPRSQLLEAQKWTVGYELGQFLLLSSGRIQELQSCRENLE